MHHHIAKKLNRHHSTISREIIGNTGLREYRPRQASLLTPFGTVVRNFS